MNDTFYIRKGDKYFITVEGGKPKFGLLDCAFKFKDYTVAQKIYNELKDMLPNEDLEIMKGESVLSAFMGG